MPGKFNYDHRFKYPHLIGEDSKIWTRFITSFPNRFDSVDYDLHIGLGAKVFTIDDPKSQHYWTQLTKKRIDVVAFKDDKITIIEVKKRAGLYTLGQILGYKFLYLRENPDVSDVELLVICWSVDQDTEQLFNYYNIPFIVI